MSDHTNAHFESAVQSGDLGGVRIWLEAGAHIDSRRYHSEKMTPLMTAAHLKHNDILRYLVGRGADVTLTDKYGFGVMQYAPLCDAANLSLLVEKGADPKAASANGVVPLLRAIDADLADNIRLLHGFGVDIENAPEDMMTPLMRAANADSLKCFLYLMQQKVPLDTEYYLGGTALTIAIERPPTLVTRTIIDALLTAGARTDIPSREEGLNAFDLARQCGNAAALSLLDEHKARQVAARERHIHHGFSTPIVVTAKCRIRPNRPV